MFGLFKSQPVAPELPEEKRLYFDNQFHWLLENFGESPLEQEQLTPTPEHFPLIFDGSEKPVEQLKEILCRQMEIDPAQVHLDYFVHRKDVLDAGASQIWLQGSNASYASGLYWGKAEDGRYHIWLSKAHLRNPEALTATMGHELAHIRLLGERKLNSRYDHDHELITEMLCVFSGLGVFRANESFRINKGFDGWSYRYAGYLRQQSWGYLLALYAFLRDEKNPAWSKHLSGTVKKDFERSLRWLNETPAGKQFLDGKWTNDHYGMEKKNFSGTWIKQSTYGEQYGEGVAGKTMLTEIEITDEDGHLTGTGRDTEGHDIQDVPLTIKGTVRGDSIQFELQYHYTDKVVDGIVVRKAEKESYSVSYNGYFSFFLDAFIGEWRILKEDPEKGLLSYGSGTWEMKRK